ncbi:MAG: glycerophosphodiester phosphodiesterase family protein [Polyangiales bacterium]
MQPICYAHRGASAELPENTLPAFARALELGADALETDAYLSPDGKVVLAHDPPKSWSDLPTLMSALSECPGVTFNVDAKPESPALVDAMVGLIRRLGAQSRVRIASFHASNLRRVRALGYEGETGLVQTEVAKLVFQPMALLRRSPVRGQAAQVPLRVGPIRLDTASFIAKCHSLGLRVDYWTINDVATAQRLLALGADGIMTDDPKRIAPVVRAFRERR